MDKLAWLYDPNAKPAKELSKHDQRMIQLGWDAHRTYEPQPDQSRLIGDNERVTIIDNSSTFEILSINIAKAQLAKDEARIEALIEYLGLYGNELGFCEISNHIPFKKLKATHCKGEEE